MLTNYFKAKYPGLAIITAEETRALFAVMKDVSSLNTPFNKVLIWSALQGFTELVFKDGKPNLKESKKFGNDDFQDLQTALSYRDKEGRTLYIFMDIQTWSIQENPLIARALKEMLQDNPRKGSSSVFIGVDFPFTPEIEKLVTVVDFPLPTSEELTTILDNMITSANRSTEKLKTKKIKLSKKLKEEIIHALSGLTTEEAENAISLALIEHKVIEGKGAIKVGTINREKISSVKRSGLLEIINPEPRGLNAIGGLENLKEWILKRKMAFTEEAETFGLPPCKGVLIIGIPGTGKSLTAKTIGTAFNIPTLKLDVSDLFRSLVGQSEARVRRALKLAERISPCVLWLDEVDKGMSGVGSGINLDSGVTKRVFGIILSWMQEKPLMQEKLWI